MHQFRSILTRKLTTERQDCSGATFGQTLATIAEGSSPPPIFEPSARLRGERTLNAPKTWGPGVRARCLWFGPSSEVAQSLTAREIIFLFNINKLRNHLPHLNNSVLHGVNCCFAAVPAPP
jgi:hypothetical protein